MNFEDLCFSIENDDGLIVECDIIYVIPNGDSKDEPYIVYTDYTLGEKNEFSKYYGQILKLDQDYVLKKIKDKELIDKIKLLMKNKETVKVNKQIHESLHS